MQYTPFDEETYSDAGELIRDWLSEPTRPRKITVKTPIVYSMESDPKQIEKDYVRVRGSDFFVRRMSTYAAFGGRLEYDLIFIIGCDGVRSGLMDVRYMQRPEPKAKPITATRLRAVPLDRLVKEAMTTHRAVFRRPEPDLVVLVRDEAERSGVNATSLDARRYTARTSASDEQLQRVADEYRLAVAHGDRYPTKHVQIALELPTRDIAAKWVARARRDGLIPPAPRRGQGGFNR